MNLAVEFAAARSAAPEKLVLPELGKTVCRQLSVANGILDISMPQIVLNSPSIVSVVDQLIPTGMAQHMGVYGERPRTELRNSAKEFAKASCCHRSAPFRDK